MNERTRCPICGHDFYDEKWSGERPCPSCKEWIDFNDLIGDQDDYAWCV